ncbi:hypothetical protein CPB85DRAFT_1325882 [Mucidula mucida]|nr:hypothetical protein CPB85DRAFT_1325882 [Mucidula mucida]
MDAAPHTIVSYLRVAVELPKPTCLEARYRILLSSSFPSRYHFGTSNVEVQTKTRMPQIQSKSDSINLKKLTWVEMDTRVDNSQLTLDSGHHLQGQRTDAKPAPCFSGHDFIGTPQGISV